MSVHIMRVTLSEEHCMKKISTPWHITVKFQNEQREKHKSFQRLQKQASHIQRIRNQNGMNFLTRRYNTMEYCL